MKKLYALIASSLLIFSSCNKEINKSENNIYKGAKYETGGTFVLIPAGALSVIAYLPDGRTPFGLFSANRLIEKVYINNSAICRIINPNLYQGLPSIPNGVVFSGLAVDKSQSTTNDIFSPDIILSRTNNVEHGLFFAGLDANNNYSIYNYLTVNASFASATSGWKLTHVEYEASNNKLYGVFYNLNNFTSIVAEINKLTGNAIAIKTFMNMRFTGMDFTSDGVNGQPDYMYLLSGVSSTTNTSMVNTTCKIIKLNLISLSFTTVTTNLPRYYNLADPYLNGFLTTGKGSVPFYIYVPEQYQISGYNILSNSTVDQISQKYRLYIDNPGWITTEGSPDPFNGEIMTDAGN